MLQPLPPNQYGIGTQERNAYATCLRYEMEAIAGLHPVISGLQSVALARVLGYMIIHAPTALGRTNISNAVMSCATTERLADVAKLYVTHFIGCFRSEKGRTPAPSSPPSPSFDIVSDTILHELLEAPQNHQTAKRLALIRDDYRCVISGRVDMTTYKTNPEVKAAWDVRFAQGHIPGMGTTHCAHIIPESLNHNISGENEGGVKHQYAASVWAVMDRFGEVCGIEELNGPDIHCMENVMTMNSNLYDCFDSLDIWLEATQTINQYNVRATRPAFLTQLGVQNPITLPTNHDLSAPDPRYLKLHAACAQVAHLSGAAEYFDNILKDIEGIRVLAQDGSSSDLLDFKLLPLTKYG
ncbi:hypothetical protein FIBSPDRAFT_964551 [Athelia psychrophila]|uniref:HNH nuclease domain-containing protein n=1 Tax=Athelia psychrophila TaxID=1759441 RepID=A0A165XP29_9AGAM|nr:hypothetical protein FIBSPDRAFT_964551 [Fibularhizoctonia sp. CBS 109695]